MNRKISDRNLLVGILAFQNGLIRRNQLLAAMNASLVDKQTPLEDILHRQGALDAETRELLAALVSRHLTLNENDPEKSLRSISSIGSVRHELQSLGDPDVNASLAQVSAELNTVPPTVGVSTSRGDRFRIRRPHARGGLGEGIPALQPQ